MSSRARVRPEKSSRGMYKYKTKTGHPRALKKEEATQASRRNVQVAGGTVLTDRVAVFNAFAAQEDSGWKSQSDDDVVLVSLCWRLHTQAKTARPVVPKVTAAHTGSWPRRSNTANGSE